MFKNISKVLIGSVVLGICIIAIFLYIINNRSYESYKKDFIEEENLYAKNYIHEKIENINSIIETNAYWAEAIEKLNVKDEEWLSENATTYVVDNNLGGVDYLLVSDENTDFIQQSGGDYKNILLKNKNVIDTLKNDKTNNFFTKIDGKYALVVSSPFYDDDYENATGLYLCLMFFDENTLNNLKEHLSKHLLNVKIVEKGDLNKNINDKEIIISNNILDSNYYLEAHYSDENIEKIFFAYNNILLEIIIIVAIIVSGMILLFVFKMDKKLKEIITAIVKVSNGDYDTKVKVEKKSLLKEFEILAVSINKMSFQINQNLNKVEQNYLEMIRLILKVQKSNDEYTSNHNISVGKYAKILAENLNYPNIEDVVLASEVHDIGKISIPTNILNKPGKLTKEEYEVIKKHPVEGYNIIDGISYFESCKDGVKYHHERWDGTGYPEGLKGNEIPFLAQIISLADVYDAVTSDRVYRKGLTHEKAKQIIISEKGKAFNPEIVDMFIEIEEEFKKLNKNLNKGI